MSLFSASYFFHNHYGLHLHPGKQVLAWVLEKHGHGNQLQSGTVSLALHSHSMRTLYNVSESHGLQNCRFSRASQKSKRWRDLLVILKANKAAQTARARGRPFLCGLVSWMRAVSTPLSWIFGRRQRSPAEDGNTVMHWARERANASSKRV